MSLEKFHELVNSARKITMLNLELEEQVEQLKLENRVLSKTSSLESYVENLKRSVSEQGMLISGQIQQIADLKIKLFQYTKEIDNTCYVQSEYMTEEEQFESYSQLTKEQLIKLVIEANKNLYVIKGIVNPYYLSGDNNE